MPCCTSAEKSQAIQKDQVNKKKKIEKNSKFNPKNTNQLRIWQKYRFPAEFNRAQVHLSARKFGYYDHSNSGKDKEKSVIICPCCNSCIFTQEISIFEGTTDPVRPVDTPFLLGSSSALFFSFIKMSALYLLIIFLVCGLYGFVSSLDGNYCKSRQQIGCSETSYQVFSTYNKYGNQKLLPSIQLHNILCLVAVVLSIIFFLIYRRVTYNLNNQIDQQIYTQDDYTIFVQNIPIISFKGQLNQKASQIDGKHQKRIRKIFDDQIELWLKSLELNNQKGIQKEMTSVFKKKSITNPTRLNKVTSISMCYDLQKFQQQRKVVMDKHLQRVNDDRLNQEQLFRDIDTQLKGLNDMQLNNSKKFVDKKDFSFHLSHFSGACFVSFEYPQFKDYILDRHDKGKIIFKLNDQALKLSPAAHPTDINWYNLNLADSDRSCRIVVSHIIVLMVLFFCAGLLICVDILKVSGTREGEKSQTTNYVLSIINSIIVFAVNRGIWWVINSLTDYERHKTSTGMISYQLTKAILVELINSVMIFYLIQIIMDPPYLASNGLVVQASAFIISDGFLSIFLSMVNFDGWLRYLKLLTKYGYISEEKMIQRQQYEYIYNYQINFNKDYQLPVFDMTGEYLKYLLQLYTCMFFSYLIPIGPLVVMIYLGLNFWVDKFKLFKLCSKYKQLGYFLTDVVFKLFEGSLLVFTIGNLIFSTTINHKGTIDIINVISFILALTYVIISVFASHLIEYIAIGTNESDDVTLSYSECLEKLKFTETYWSQNPATMFFDEENINNANLFFKPKAMIEIFGEQHMRKVTKKKRYGDNFVQTLI